jgi:hypothetical protein
LNGASPDEFVAAGGDLAAMEHHCQLYAENPSGKSTKGILDNGNRFRANLHEIDGKVTIDLWDESGGFWKTSDWQQLATPELLHRAAKAPTGCHEEVDALCRSYLEAHHKLQNAGKSAESSTEMKGGIILLCSLLLVLIAGNAYGWLLFCVIGWAQFSASKRRKEYEKQEFELRKEYERLSRKYNQAQNALLQTRLGVRAPSFAPISRPKGGAISAH